MKKTFIRIAITMFAAFTMTIIPIGTAAAANCPNSNDPKGQVLQGVGESGSNCDDSGVATTLKTAVNILSFFAGAIAVIMLIVSGIRFTTSGGDSNSVSGAKNALIYAIIGLVVVALAQVIVHFVLNAIISGNVDTNTK